MKSLLKSIGFVFFLTLISFMIFNACTVAHDNLSPSQADADQTSHIGDKNQVFASEGDVTISLVTPEEMGEDIVPAPNPTIVASASQDVPSIDSESCRKWKNSVYNAWHQPENEVPVAYVGGEPIVRRIPLLRNASIWFSIDDAMERNVFLNEEEKSAYLEQYGETYEQSLHQCILSEIAYQEGKKMGFSCPEEIARKTVTDRLDSNRLVEGFYEFTLEANGVGREEYISRCIPLEQKQSIENQFRQWLKSNIEENPKNKNLDLYYQQYLEEKMEEYEVEIITN